MIVVVAVLAGLAGCAPEPVQRETVQTVTMPSPVDGAVSAIASRDSSIAASAALFESAPLVVVAGVGSTLESASVTVALGVPLFVEPRDDAALDVLVEELDRLGTTAVVTVAAGALDGLEADDRTVYSFGDAAGLAEAFRLETVPPDAALSDLQNIAALTSDVDVAADATPSPSASATAPPLPEVRPGRARDDTVALVVDDDELTAPAATARAAGADVLVLPADAGDLFASTATTDALAASAPASVLAIGDVLAADPSLTWKVDVAVSGARLPGGGLSWFPEHTLVAIYGVPGSGALGVLGEQDAAASVARAQSVAAPYVPLTTSTVVPTFEMIATVAVGSAGSDGNFSNEGSVDTIAPWVQAADDAGMQVILDLQPGRTDFLTQAQQYEQLLSLPNVGLALDPEWRLGPDQVPLAQIGTVSAAEVNSVTTWLADLTRDNALPPKPVVLHQFRASMISDRASLDTSRPELELLIHVDGQGGQSAKQSTWNALHTDAPADVFWGWKNFYDEDSPVLTPEQTMTEVVPAPNMISYQ